MIFSCQPTQSFLLAHTICIRAFVGNIHSAKQRVIFFTSKSLKICFQIMQNNIGCTVFWHRFLVLLPSRFRHLFSCYCSMLGKNWDECCTSRRHSSRKFLPRAIFWNCFSTLGERILNCISLSLITHPIHSVATDAMYMSAAQANILADFFLFLFFYASPLLAKLWLRPGRIKVAILEAWISSCV